MKISCLSVVAIKNGLLYVRSTFLFILKNKMSAKCLHPKTFHKERMRESKERTFPDLDPEDKVNQEKQAHGRQERLQDKIELERNIINLNSTSDCLSEHKTYFGQLLNFLSIKFPTTC